MNTHHTDYNTMPDPTHPREPLTAGECIALALPLAGLIALLTVVLAS
jgi:hypothetical protein